MQTLAQPGPEAGVPTLVDAKFGLRQHQPLADGSARAPEQVSSPPQQEHLCSPGRANNPLLKNLPCQAGEFEVCQIRPSAQYFTQETVAKLGPEMEDKVGRTS